jgi:1-acyl-sn-glycerol-3-phosphate acyltransferase
MRKLRAVRRIIAFLVITLWHYIWFELFVLFNGGIRSERAFKFRTRMYRSWGRSISKAFGLTLTISGSPPKAPYFFVMNHLSYADILVVACALDDATFIAKHDMASWLLIGPLATRLGAIYVDRKSVHGVADVTAKVDAALRAGYGVGMAAEATTTKGETVIPFNSTFLEPAVQLGLPVHYATIRFSTPPDEFPAFTHVNWWEDITFQAHVWRFLQLKSFSAEVRFGEAPILDGNRKTLARQLHAAVIANFKPMVTADGQRID